MNKPSVQKAIFHLLAFCIPFSLYWLTHSNSLGFADAGEFSLVTKIGSIAHPPGFPSYVFLGWLWGKILFLFYPHHVLNMVLFSIFCASIASLLLFKTILAIIEKTFNNAFDEVQKNIVALTSAIIFSTGVNVWHWANNIEVYALQVTSIALLIYGLTNYSFTSKKYFLLLASLGMSIGLGNHHLTMIVFIPFSFLFFRNDFFTWKEITPDKNKKKPSKISPAKNISKIKFNDLKYFVGWSAVFTLFFYLLMFVRAQSELPFKFGNPDNLSRMFYHLSGGAWQENTAASVKGIIGLRIPYFMNLTFEQLFAFIPFSLLGIYFLLSKKLFPLLISIVVYFLLLLIYQLRIDQVADTDAYMLLPFYTLALLAPYGILSAKKVFRQIVFVLPLLVILQAVVNFPKTDKRKLNVSESLMRELDKSAPLKSTILISDWTLIIQYYYYRLVENFRPDLTVLNYDIKFTNYTMLPLMYPDLYKTIQPEYDKFVELLGNAHPQDIYNTGCHLDSPELMQSFTALIHAIQKRCDQTNTAFMADPRAFVFLMDYKLMSPSAFVSGCFVSNTNTGLNKDFIKLNQQWLSSPLTLTDPASSDKLVDLEAMIDFHRNYYRSTNDTTDFQVADASYNRIKKLQKDMKKNMQFLFRTK